MIASGTSLLQYSVVEKIGEGGMGAVWKATDATLDRDVAIKVLPVDFAGDAERLARFEREAKVLASLNHPNIGAIYGFHEAGGTRFLAMELVPGEDLSQRLAKASIPSSEAVEIARQIAEALEYAHERGIVHRDLKPANLFLLAGPEGLRLKALDFGLALLEDDLTRITRAGEIMGTVHYLSPEQARGARDIDHRTDLYAMGVILYELCTGKRPFQPCDEIGVLLRKAVGATETLGVDFPQTRMITTATLGDIVKQARKVKQLGTREFAHQAAA